MAKRNNSSERQHGFRGKVMHTYPLDFYERLGNNLGKRNRCVNCNWTAKKPLIQYFKTGCRRGYTVCLELVLGFLKGSKDIELGESKDIIPEALSQTGRK